MTAYSHGPRGSRRDRPYPTLWWSGQAEIMGSLGRNSSGTAKIDAVGVAERVGAQDDCGLSRRSRAQVGARIALMVIVTHIT